MGLFDKLKGKKETVDWSNAYTATPKFYGKPDGTPFGAIALTEGTETVLPKTPQNKYRVDGKVVSEWKLVLVSITKDTIIGDADYFTVMLSRLVDTFFSRTSWTMLLYAENHSISVA